jgi:hypothetical protein
MRSEWEDPREDLFVPGTPGRDRPAFIDAAYAAQAPRDLSPSRGSSTAHFEKSTGDLVVDFKDRPVDEEVIKKNLKGCREEHGEALTHLTLVICAEVMREDALWLDAKKFERQPDNPKSAMFCWRKALPKPRKKKAEEQ